MKFGSAGAGSGLHVCAVLLNTLMGTNITHVPYRGSALALQVSDGGRIDFMCDQTSTAFPHIQAGVVKAIATLGPARPPVLPDLPTAQEQGLADLDCSSWSAFVFPKGTPEAIVRRLAQATSEAVDMPFVRERFASIGDHHARGRRQWRTASGSRVVRQEILRQIRAPLDRWRHRAQSAAGSPASICAGGCRRRQVLIQSALHNDRQIQSGDDRFRHMTIMRASLDL